MPEGGGSAWASEVAVRIGRALQYATTGVRYVTLVARDDVKVDMGYGLTSSRTVIDANGEGRRGVSLLDAGEERHGKIPERGGFLGGELGQAGDMTARNDQAVTRGSWVVVGQGEDEPGGVGDGVVRAQTCTEWAGWLGWGRRWWHW